MRKIVNLIQKFGKDEDGAALVEYAAILGVILAVGLTILGTIGTDINNIFTKLEAILAPLGA